MARSKDLVKVAVIQSAPIFFDRVGSAQKAISLIQEASKEGANLILFPEAFIPCYPRGLTFGARVGSRSTEGRFQKK